MVRLNGPTKSQLCLKIPKEKYFMHLTLYNFIFKIDNKFVKLSKIKVFLEHPKSHTHYKYRLSSQHNYE